MKLGTDPGLTLNIHCSCFRYVSVFSMGLMPYTGLPNRVVMELVTGGGRLDNPNGCPPFIYNLMSSCWHPVPDARPTFQHLLHKLLGFARNEELMKEPIPHCFGETSGERDRTVMRAPNDDFCLQMPNSSDYLIPLPDSRTIAKRLLNEGAGTSKFHSFFCGCNFYLYNEHISNIYF